MTMLRPRTRYLDTICCSSKTLSAKSLTKFDTKLLQYTTSDPVHALDVKNAVKQLEHHFARKDPPRPLNCVILGGPGSGKTFLAEQLKDAAASEYREYNLSQFHHPSDIRPCFIEVAEFLRENPQKNILVFFDEFDVRISGMTAIQYLIQPMYDGKMRADGKKHEFKRAAFLFSGSYLKEKRLFDSIAGNEQLDLARMLFDSYRATGDGIADAPYRNRVWRALMAVTAYDPVRQRLATDRDVVAYVRSLDKIVDFVSRINGFVVELRNLNTPLFATRDRYRIELESNHGAADSAAVAPNPQIAGQLVSLVDGLRQADATDWFYDYRTPQEPVLQYKNLLLIDRLARAVDMLKRTHGATSLKISRDLLNYLVVAPLVHGMRSLMTVIETLIAKQGVLSLPSDTGVAERNVARFCDYDSPEAVWARVRRHNPIFAANKLLDTDGKTPIVLV
jgi:hypothetical protein